MAEISSLPNTTPPDQGIDERVKMLLKYFKSEAEMGCGGDTFAERAEWYYQKRPQLLALLQDLYNGYNSLFDRCNRMEKGRKHSKHYSSSSMSMVLDDDDQDQEDSAGGSSICQFLDWDAESSLSYQPPQTPIQHGSSRNTTLGIDEVVADLVMKNVENDILVDQLNDMEKQQQGQESIWRKIELLKKLLEVLESERIVLLNENVKLGYKVQALMEENKGLSTETMFLKRKAGELARCVLKMREDQRVYMLTRKIEDLQGQIYGLEMRNKEHCQQLLKSKEQGKEEKISSKDGVAFVGCCFQVEKLKLKNRCEGNGSKGDAKGWAKWWDRVKSMDFFMCGLQYSP